MISNFKLLQAMEFDVTLGMPDSVGMGTHPLILQKKPVREGSKVLMITELGRYFILD